jgi:hypothetical protein
MLFHGSSDRWGILGKGQYVVPADAIDVNTTHEEADYPESGQYAHATENLTHAKNYARWSAMGAHEDAETHGDASPVIYQVEPASDMEEDPYAGELNYRSRHGFKVVQRVDDKIGNAIRSMSGAGNSH